MTLRNLDFETWEKNHVPDHNAKWYRELYPYNVFRRIQFSKADINRQQRIEFNRIHYYATVKKIELQVNGRFRATFDLSTFPASKTQSWKKIAWNLTFQIIYSADGFFITVYAKRDDPSEEFVTKFMKGNFEKISLNKSLPVSELLFRTLLLHLAEENFSDGQHNQSFNFIEEGIIHLPEHPEFVRKRLDFAPFYSVGRSTWICYSFSEEKAHRIAFQVANQCENLLVVYCNPTYTRHHRCVYPNTRIISLYEFANLASKESRTKYENQIKFLQNHLNVERHFSLQELLEEIETPKQSLYNINRSDLMEALGVMKITPTDKYDAFYSLSAINLINAWISRKRRSIEISPKDNKLFKNMYYFKTYLSDILTTIILGRCKDIEVYIEKDLVMVELMGFQFSFHNVPKTDTIVAFEESTSNKVIVWREKRLQPIAPLLLHYSRMLRQASNDKPS